ncbi:MAG: hypothetical protein HQ483_18360 [Rhodospirillales bacterium]|nr:hypothetical protein [Rhodospirillales bacterium]
MTVRCDNGPEYVNELLAAWAEKRGIGAINGESAAFLTMPLALHLGLQTCD